LENLDDVVNNKRTWEEEKCSELLGQRIKRQISVLQDRSEINGNYMKNIRRETNRHFRNKNNEHLKGKINEFAMNSKNMNIRDLCRGINGCKLGYQPRCNMVKDENGDLLADRQNTLNRWKKYISQLLNGHRVSGAWQVVKRLSR
jgi:hypothetical protein